MEPKFQSSFIPKGPLTSSASDAFKDKKGKGKGLLSFLALVLFIFSIILAVGIFGYKFFLKYSIDKMGTALNEARAALQPETIDELTRFDNRIISAEELLSKHQVLTPLFEFLESSTPRTVRFSEFRYLTSEQGLELQMRGEARGYAALALQADIFSKSEHFDNPIFSDLRLNERGEVLFSFKTNISSSLVSYAKEVERLSASLTVPPLNQAEGSSLEETPDDVSSGDSDESAQN